MNRATARLLPYVAPPLATPPVVQLMTLETATAALRAILDEYRPAPDSETAASYTPDAFGAKYGHDGKWARGLIARGELGSYQARPGGRHTILAKHEAAWLERAGGR